MRNLRNEAMPFAAARFPVGWVKAAGRGRSRGQQPRADRTPAALTQPLPLPRRVLGSWVWAHPRTSNTTWHALLVNGHNIRLIHAEFALALRWSQQPDSGSPVQFSSSN